STVKLDDSEITTRSSVPEKPRCDHVPCRIHCHTTGHVEGIGRAIDHLAPDLGTTGLVEFDDSEVAARVRIREVASSDYVAGRVHRDSVGAITALSGRCRAVDDLPPQHGSTGSVDLEHGEVLGDTAVLSHTRNYDVPSRIHGDCASGIGGACCSPDNIHVPRRDSKHK